MPALRQAASSLRREAHTRAILPPDRSRSTSSSMYACAISGRTCSRFFTSGQWVRIYRANWCTSADMQRMVLMPVISTASCLVRFAVCRLAPG